MLPLAFGLDAFCDDRKAQGASKADDCVNHGVGLVLNAKVSDEGSVNLDFVDRILLQIAEARIAGSKVIECDLETEPA